MTRLWLSPEDALDPDIVREVGEQTAAAQADAWILGGSADEARKLAAGASPDRRVVYVTPEGSSPPWDALGTDFDDIVSPGVSAAELTARLRAATQDRRTEPRALMLRMLAHDLNNPLTAIRLLSEVVSYEITGDDAKEDMRSILDAADAAGSLVEALSAYAKLNSPKRGPTGSVDVTRALDDARRRPSLSKGLNIEVPTAPLLVRGDMAALNQAILDVLLNASKIADSGGESFVTAGDIGGDVVIEARIQVRRVPEDLHLLVQEHGPAQLRDQRVPVAATGLVHAAHTAESAGGRLQLQGEGTRLTMRLVLPRDGR